MTGRVVSWLVIAVCSVLLLCSGLFSAVFVGGGAGVPAGCYMPADASASASSPLVDLTPPAGGFDPIGDWSSEQVGNAATIVTVGVQLGIPPRGWVIAVATAMQESTLTNLPHLGAGNDHDSVGLFQQRPSQGWGTVAQLMDPGYASMNFFRALRRVDGWQSMALTDAAQAVQTSAYPGAYATWEDDATTLVGALTGLAGQLGDCGANVGPMGWTQPIIAEVGSGFRTADRPSHDGVDFSVGKGTAIHAAASGVVTRVRCNAIDVRTGGDWGCDRDGNPELTSGCGWYVDIEHPNPGGPGGVIVTRYCHLLTRPAVAEGERVVAGQVIGVAGSSGHSSGPHLHYEVHLGDHSPATAVDPVAFHRLVCAPLGRFAGTPPPCEPSPDA
ncbi:M23 family metallopeptidase [Solwaraspora sp. WMMD1047]|uniref:M23 family metallopeptidase n=1 Tax=Solwaraspora sp. WMMD1047 TaxID=3016102 RepID=UPI0024159B4F|nr:M23 family metallopeptidase [Solwaraspora sp. WMMD1047]MDG4834173.1 M23 family metallopeptidase [Solwaraspora sp. WMMD1047]